jgi:hypothetical protein
MLYQNYSFEQSQNQIFSVLKELQIAKLLYKANIRKGCGLSALEMFQRLVMLVFHGRICSVPWNRSITTMLFPRIPITVSLATLPSIGRSSSCFWPFG